METPGTLVDKLITVDLKMWNNQEALYSIRRGTFDDFCQQFKLEKNDGAENLYKILKKACDLNVQRNSLMNETDEKFLEMFRTFATFIGIDNGIINNAMARMNEKYNIKPHKTY